MVGIAGFWGSSMFIFLFVTWVDCFVFIFCELCIRCFVFVTFTKFVVVVVMFL